jgi:hypothetical protein
MKFYQAFIRFFPVQLFIVHVKYNLVLLVFWAVLYAFVLRIWGNAFGVPLLFLDPEYLGKVDFFSYLIMGISFGGFAMAFQIASYIVNSIRFPFLASVSRPFVKYTVNNFFFPLSFVITYIICAFQFQDLYETTSRTDILLNLGGFMVGALLFFILSLTYFFTASKDIFKIFGVDILKKTDRKRVLRVQLTGNNWQRISKRNLTVGHIQIDTYLSGNKIVRARDTAHYDPEIIRSVFQQNHFAAAVFELIVVGIMLVVGFFRDIPFFMIPAGASIFLSMTMLLMIASAIHTWLREWSVLVFIVLIVGLNWLSGYEFFGKRNHAYGLNYSIASAVLPDSMLYDKAKRLQVENDSKSGLRILENWKSQSFQSQGRKPTIIFLNVSGGGLKSALWTLRALQVADSTCNGRLLQNTRLVTGSSGGMIGAAYLRELYLRKIKGEKINLYSSEYTDRISRDILNPVGFSLAVNDVFLRLQRVKIAGQTYTRDRGYEFEKALHFNTNHLLDKAITAYRKDELKGRIPLMVFSPTIINDGRRMLICSQPISYLTYTPTKTGTILRSLPEDIEFSRMFDRQSADSLRLSSAIRMSATFPYIMPSVSLPSKPILEVMDAGFRDNYGMQTSIRYLFHFRDWIANNTERVIFLQVRENHKAYDLKTHQKSTLLELAISPLGNVYENMFRIQDYQHDQLIMYADKWFRGKMEFIELDLNPPSNPSDEIISMNFHLTTLEKKRIMKAVYAPENRAAFQELKRILTP